MEYCGICKNPIYPPGVTFTGASCFYNGQHPGTTSAGREYEKSLREMYELGMEHGKTLAEKDAEIRQLYKDIEYLNQVKE